MDKIRAIRWVAFSLAILAVTLVFIDIDSGHIERSMSLMFTAMAIGAVALGLDLWARTSPTSASPMINGARHPLLTRVLFFGALLGLVIVVFKRFCLTPNYASVSGFGFQCFPSLRWSPTTCYSDLSASCESERRIE